MFRIGGNGGGYAHRDLEDEDESLPSVIINTINFSGGTDNRNLLKI